MLSMPNFSGPPKCRYEYKSFTFPGSQVVRITVEKISNFPQYPSNIAIMALTWSSDYAVILGYISFVDKGTYL